MFLAHGSVTHPCALSRLSLVNADILTQSSHQNPSRGLRVVVKVRADGLGIQFLVVGLDARIDAVGI